MNNFDKIFKWADNFENVVNSTLYTKDHRRHYNAELDGILLQNFIQEARRHMSAQSAAYYDIEDDPIVIINQRLAQENAPVRLLRFDKMGTPVFDKQLHLMKPYISLVQRIVNEVLNNVQH